eukprot:scaffold12042_cov61-Phaeocystis_antarctica.AAC.5
MDRFRAGRNRRSETARARRARGRVLSTLYRSCSSLSSSAAPAPVPPADRQKSQIKKPQLQSRRCRKAPRSSS